MLESVKGIYLATDTTTELKEASLRYAPELTYGMSTGLSRYKSRGKDLLRMGVTHRFWLSLPAGLRLAIVDARVSSGTDSNSLITGQG